MNTHSRQPTIKMTFNRRLILSVLAEGIDGSPPPHPARSILYCLENAFEYKWENGLYPQMKTVPSMWQIYRTLKELWQAGLIVGTREKEEPDYHGRLARWVMYYQLSGDVYKNDLIAQCNEVYRKVDKAKNGVKFFGAVFDKGLPAEEVKPLSLRVKTLMQKTHPDKASGYEYEFKQMQQCLAWIKSGIPLPDKP